MNFEKLTEKILSFSTSLAHHESTCPPVVCIYIHAYCSTTQSTQRDVKLFSLFSHFFPFSSLILFPILFHAATERNERKVDDIKK